jgi:hypothetical protein
MEVSEQPGQSRGRGYGQHGVNRGSARPRGWISGGSGGGVGYGGGHPRSSARGQSSEYRRPRGGSNNMRGRGYYY